jgi:hypothetical protein
MPETIITAELAVIGYHYQFMASTGNDRTTGSDEWAINIGSWHQPIVIDSVLSLLGRGLNHK